MVSAGLANEFVRLVSDMSFVVFALLAAGIIFITLEIITPESGRFGICGFLLIVLSAVLLIVAGGTPAMLFLYAVIIFVVILGIFCSVMVIQKTAWINEAKRREELRGMPDGSQKRTDYNFLLGLEGTTTSLLAPTGQMTLGDTNFFVTSDLGVIEFGKKVRVVEVRGENIVVQEIE